MSLVSSYALGCDDSQNTHSNNTQLIDNIGTITAIGAAAAGSIIVCNDDNCVVNTNHPAIKNSIVIRGASKNNSVYLENRGKVEAIGAGATSGSIILNNTSDK